MSSEVAIYNINTQETVKPFRNNVILLHSMHPCWTWVF